MTFLIDVHHIGGHQTGNETIARNISRELVQIAGDQRLAFAACRAGSDEVAALVGTTPHVVSDSALRRVVWDIPRVGRRVDATALLVQYTTPRTSRPCVTMVHDLSPFDPRSEEWLSRRFRTRVRASISHSARSASILVACSQFTRQGLIDRFGLHPDRVVHAPCAVDPELARLIDQSPHVARTNGPIRLIAVGNVLPRKNLGVVANALVALRRRHIDAELRVVGAVPAEGQTLAGEIESLLGSSVSFTGYVTSNQLAAEYAAADVMVFPSLFEGFGIPAIEAMYAGVPVVTSDTSSLPEVVGDAGLVVPANDIAAWIDTLDRVITGSELRKDLATRGLKQARATSWRTSAQLVLDSLDRAARGK